MLLCAIKIVHPTSIAKVRCDVKRKTGFCCKKMLSVAFATVHEKNFEKFQKKACNSVSVSYNVRVNVSTRDLPEGKSDVKRRNVVKRKRSDLWTGFFYTEEVGYVRVSLVVEKYGQKKPRALLFRAGLFRDFHHNAADTPVFVCYAGG